MARAGAYGTWASPLSAAAVAAGGLRLGAVALDGEDIYWLEGRPSEGGRYALVKRTPDGTITDVTPRDMNVRSRVHEYGGGAYLVAAGVAFVVNFSDQRVYRLAPGEQPQPITPEGAWFYADFALDSRRKRLICVREDHTGSGEAVNTLVSIHLGPAEAHYDADEILTSGYDFYSTPRLSPDASTLAWLSWRHPNMPWDGTELWVADVTESGALENARQIAGGPAESIYQPGWSPEGTSITSTTDPATGTSIGRIRRERHARYARHERSERVECRVRTAAVGVWNIDVAIRRAVATRHVLHAQGAMASRHRGSGDRCAHGHGARAHAERMVGGQRDPRGRDRRIRHATRRRGSVDLASGVVETIRRGSTLEIDEGYVSVAEPIAFETTGGEQAHAFYLAPRNRDFGACQRRPPLVVISHGGPTSAARPTLDLQINAGRAAGLRSST